MMKAVQSKLAVDSFDDEASFYFRDSSFERENKPVPRNHEEGCWPGKTKMEFVFLAQQLKVMQFDKLSLLTKCNSWETCDDKKFEPDAKGCLDSLATEDESSLGTLDYSMDEDDSCFDAVGGVSIVIEDFERSDDVDRRLWRRTSLFRTLDDDKHAKDCDAFDEEHLRDENSPSSCEQTGCFELPVLGPVVSFIHHIFGKERGRRQNDPMIMWSRR